jgi:hypothetical protein
MVLVVAAKTAADLRIMGHELDAGDPLHLLEAELNLVAPPVAAPVIDTASRTI